jgi:hypothetical protein
MNVKAASWMILFLFLSSQLPAQQERRTEAGAMMSFAAEKDLIRNLTVHFEEELRLITGGNGFSRATGSLGADYSLMDKRVEAGAYYAFIYLYNDDHLYESRHRFFINLSYRQTVGSFTLSWRIRLQETLRNESRGSYRVNPRYVMKNKLEASYAIWGKPWRPFLSCDFSTNLNDPETRYDAVRLRFQGGITRRINRTASIDVFFRWDEYLKNNDPRTLSLGVAYKLTLRTY